MRLLTQQATAAIALCNDEKENFLLSHPGKSIDRFNYVINIIKNLKGFSYKRASNKIKEYVNVIPVNDSSREYIVRLSVSFKNIHDRSKVN